MGTFKDGKTVTGWGVIRGGDNPWHFAGIFSSKEEAEKRAAELGPEYEVRWGDNQEGTDNFMSSSHGVTQD